MGWLFSQWALKAHVLGLSGILLFSVLLIFGDGVTPPEHFRIALLAWCAGYPIMLAFLWRANRRESRNAEWERLNLIRSLQEGGPLDSRTAPPEGSEEVAPKAFGPGDRVRTAWGQTGTVLALRPHPMNGLGLVMVRIDECGELEVPVLGCMLERLPAPERPFTAQGREELGEPPLARPRTGGRHALWAGHGFALGKGSSLARHDELGNKHLDDLAKLVAGFAADRGHAAVRTRAGWFELQDFALDVQESARPHRLRPGDFRAGADQPAGDGQPAFHLKPHGDCRGVPTA